MVTISTVEAHFGDDRPTAAAIANALANATGQRFRELPILSRCAAFP
jgi:hypothetical protein